jgi:hypothetical protein
MEIQVREHTRFRTPSGVIPIEAEKNRIDGLQVCGIWPELDEHELDSATDFTPLQ